MALGRGRLIERREQLGRSSGEPSFDSDNTPLDAGVTSLVRATLNTTSSTSLAIMATTAGQRPTGAASVPAADVNRRPPKSKLSKGPGNPGRRKIWLVISTYGPIVGKVTDVSGRKVAVFRGIPYAQEMNRNHRFEPSRRRVMPWKHTLKAFWDGPSCPQPRHPSGHPVFSTTSQSENCLYVNVWVPLCEDGARECPRRTTVVYFHGGDLLRGSNSMPAYDGAALSGLGKVIVAVPNYRLGVFGFLNGKVKGMQPNLGLGDQYLALDWIRNNSEAFGGHPGDVVVYGHDSGAYSAGLPLFSPALKRLGVTKAILSGGSPIIATVFPSNGTKWEDFLKNVGCSHKFFDNTLQCLRKASPEKLIAAQSLAPASVGIVHPHTLLPRSPSEFLRLAQNLSGVQVLLTSTLPEGLDEVYSPVDDSVGRTGGAYPRMPERTLQDIDAANTKPQLITLFKSPAGIRQPPAAPPPSSVGFQDVFFNCPSVLFAQRACELGAEVFHVIIGQQPRFWKSAFHFKANSSYMGDVCRILKAI
ncbi:hypothetical protein HPB48_012249 [Haemaphysalis longicornis]|uniref:Carboxylesterase type B domain-containing protein n=1 Tax=Haemaphysalis longicornis TaxID=44386 RepID=A0A9J6G670_HAELO|nr:hypothetical protein HPB48_012249 [Haemaphysalis longicornis]